MKIKANHKNKSVGVNMD